MQEKQIPFNGITLTPYSDISPDGQLSDSQNMELYNGALRPSTIKSRALFDMTYYMDDLRTTFRLLTVHPIIVNNNTRNAFILECEEGGYTQIWYAIEVIGEEGTTKWEKTFAKELDDNEKILNINYIGNTLCVLTNKALKYLLWKDEEYKDLGVLPELEIQFSLIASGLVSHSVYTQGTERGEAKTYGKVVVNEIVQKRGDEEGEFVIPFFVRAAFRLYDGTLIRHTPPVLMIPNTKYNKFTYSWASAAEQNYKVETAVFSAYISATFLDKKFSLFSDIIKSIDFFVSLPIDQFDKDADFGIQNRGGENYFYGLYNETWGRHWDHAQYRADDGAWTALPDLEQNKLNEFGKTSAFFLIDSCDVKWKGDKIVRMRKNIFSNLAQQEQMTDDFDSHNSTTAYNSFTYNKRLILSNLQENVFHGHRPEMSLFYIADEPGIEGYFEFCFEIEDSILSTGKNHRKSRIQKLYYLYMPNINCRNAYLLYYDATGEYKGYITITMSPHPFLNGSYFYSFYGLDVRNSTFNNETIETTETLAVNKENELALSEVNNPFYFPIEGRNAVGNERILGLSSITKPISQGQFGQFPIIAFCTDGNYALSISDDGNILSVSPVNRDVCTNQNSITQLESSIFFTSASGAMITDGSNFINISNVLQGPQEEYFSMTFDYNDLFKKCSAVFDYIQNRIIIYAPQFEFGLIYNLSSQSWSTYNNSKEGICYNISRFPYSFIQHGEHKELFSILDQSYDFQPTQQPIEGKIITRPLKLDTLQLKRLTAFALQGIFKEKQQISLYGSNDAVNWKHIGTTKRAAVNNITGRTYKYFRFIINTKLTPEENISGFRIQYDIRPEKRLR